MRDEISLPGFDNRGQVFLSEGRILRRVDPAYQVQARAILTAYADFNMAAMGVVPTALEHTTPDLILAHERYDIVHPYEWPSLAFKQAALFHLRLMEQLDPLGLTLKDALPDNVMFQNGQPRYVDFLSIVPIASLAEEEWLTQWAQDGEDLRLSVMRQMFTGFFFLPLLAYGINRPELARSMLRTQACRMDNLEPEFRQLRSACPVSKLPWLLYTMARYRVAMRKPAPECYRRVSKILAAVPVQGNDGYATYYDGKGENFDLADTANWREKQRSVHQALDGFARGRLLDVGANTGWFSRLGASLGFSVSSLEIDEAALNALHGDIGRQDLAISALHCRWGDMETGIGSDGAPSNEDPFYCAPLVRHQADVTVMLGLIHHLALGENRSFDAIFATLANSCKQGAVIEFIDFDDALVAGNPGYFPAIAQWNSESYCLDAALTAARRYFNDTDNLPSHPATRHIIRLVKKPL